MKRRVAHKVLENIVNNGSTSRYRDSTVTEAMRVCTRGRPRFKMLVKAFLSISKLKIAMGDLGIVFEDATNSMLSFTQQSNEELAA